MLFHETSRQLTHISDIELSRSLIKLNFNGWQRALLQIVVVSSRGFLRQYNPRELLAVQIRSIGSNIHRSLQMTNVRFLRRAAVPTRCSQQEHDLPEARFSLVPCLLHFEAL